VVKLREGEVWSYDLPLAYYYRNRLAGYGISNLAETTLSRVTGDQWMGLLDEQGFLV
jgi:hypothetical protein